MKNYQLPVIAKISQWANDRNIIQGSTPIKQALKTLEECAELIESVADNDKEAISDAIGDIGESMRDARLGLLRVHRKCL
jgi:hypothetical protein